MRSQFDVAGEDEHGARLYQPICWRTQGLTSFFAASIAQVGILGGAGEGFAGFALAAVSLPNPGNPSPAPLGTTASGGLPKRLVRVSMFAFASGISTAILFAIQPANGSPEDRMASRVSSA